MSLSENNIIKLSRRGDVLLSEIKFAEGSDNPDVQVLRVGVFNHPYYGLFAITEAVLSEMLANFTLNVRRQDMAFDYFHECDKEASGWVESLYLSGDGKELWAKVKWTPKAKQMMADKEVRYFSADFAFEWTDPEKGLTYKNVLFGGGLVNRPFVKDMKPVVGLNELGGISTMTLEQMQAKLSEQTASHALALKERDDKIVTLQEDNKKLLGEIADMTKAKAIADKEAKFAKLLGEGKACVAQKEAYMAGDMEKFVELSEKINTSAKGSGKEAVNAELSEEEKEICKKLGLSEADYIAGNK
jgi:phage I-like protein